MTFVVATKRKNVYNFYIELVGVFLISHLSRVIYFWYRNWLINKQKVWDSDKKILKIVK